MTRSSRQGRVGARVGAICLGVALVAGSCGNDGPRSVQVPELVDHDRDPTAGIAEIDPGRADVLSAADLRLTVEQILGEHTWLAIDSSLAAAEGSSDVDAVLAAITANTTTLTGAIGLVYGPVGAGAVDELWVMHTQFFLDWAVARATDDEPGMARAERRLHDYEVDFASLLETATAGAIPAEAAEGLLAAHVAQVLDVLDAHLDGDGAREQAAVHEAYSYARVVGGALAAGFAAQQPDVFTGPLDDDATEARSALAADLGEWALLCADLGGVGTPLPSELEAAVDRGEPATEDVVDALDAVADATARGDAAGAHAARSEAYAAAHVLAAVLTAPTGA